MSSIRRRPKRSDIDKQLSNWSKRRIASWSLFAAALIILLQHWLAHLGFHPLGPPGALQDILIGYPTGAILGVLGLIVMDPNPRL